MGEGKKADFELVAPAESRVRRVARAEYKRPLRDYVAELVAAGMPATKAGERKLKGWIHRGRFTDDGALREPADLPPFDDLGSLAEWWRRNMEWRVPDYVLRLEVRTEAPPGDESKMPEAEGPAGDGMGIPDFDGAAHSSDIGINYIRGLVQSGIAEMNAARKAGDSKRYWNARRQFEDDVETLRKWEKDLVKIQEGKGEVLRTNVINEVFVRIFGNVSQSFTSALMKLAGDLSPTLAISQVREIVFPIRDQVFAHLKKTRFSEVWKPEENEARAVA